MTQKVSYGEILQYLDDQRESESVFDDSEDDGTPGIQATIHDVLNEPIGNGFQKVILTDDGNWSQIQPPEHVDIPESHKKSGALSKDSAPSMPTLGSSAPSSDNPHPDFDKMKSGALRLAKQLQAEYGFNNGFTINDVVDEVMPNVKKVNSKKTVEQYMKALSKNGFVETKEDPDDKRRNLYFWVKPWQKQ